MRLCLVEDQVASDLEPLTLTRPAFDLLLGSSTIGSKIERALNPARDPIRRGVVVRPHLEALQRAQKPWVAVNEPGCLADGPTFVANGRWVPPADLTLPEGGEHWVGICEGLPACALVGSGEAADLAPNVVDAWFEEVVAKVPAFEIGGRWVRRPWDLIAANSEYLIRDYKAGWRDHPTIHHLDSAAISGPFELLSIHASAQIDHYTVLDTNHGPITIAAGVVVQPFTRIEGPCYIGPRTHLFRANLRGGVTLGPECRVGGEVEQCIIHGHSNKYHEGFLGHSYVGEWVNLGAITSTSDLRNDYGPVSVPIRGVRVDTGLAKVGCFLGDHTRTAIGSMINTGTVAGVMSNLLPSGPLLPKHIPSFAAVRYGRVSPNAPLERLFDTARIVMGRRGKVFSTIEEQLFTDLYTQTRLERERAFQVGNERRADYWPLAASTLGL